MALAYADDIEIEGIVLELTRTEAKDLLLYLTAVETNVLLEQVADELEQALSDEDEEPDDDADD